MQPGLGAANFGVGIGPYTGSGASIVFNSDWGTATGTDDSALRDTGKTVPWPLITNPSSILTVVANPGVSGSASFTNCMRVTHSTTVHNGMVVMTGLWDSPQVGESRYLRVYLRVDINDDEGNFTDPSGHHPLEMEPGTGSSTEQLEWLWGSKNNGTYPFRYDLHGATANRQNWTPGTNGSTAFFPSKSLWYRHEWALTKTAVDTYTMQARLYSAGNSLLYDTDHFFAPDGDMVTYGNGLTMTDSKVTGLRLGTNGGPFSGFLRDEYSYYGGVQVRTDTWCGAYS